MKTYTRYIDAPLSGRMTLYMLYLLNNKDYDDEMSFEEFDETHKNYTIKGVEQMYGKSA